MSVDECVNIGVLQGDGAAVMWQVMGEMSRPVARRRLDGAVRYGRAREGPADAGGCQAPASGALPTGRAPRERSFSCCNMGHLLPGWRSGRGTWWPGRRCHVQRITSGRSGERLAQLLQCSPCRRSQQSVASVATTSPNRAWLRAADCWPLRRRPQVWHRWCCTGSTAVPTRCWPVPRRCGRAGGSAAGRGRSLVMVAPLSTSASTATCGCRRSTGGRPNDSPITGRIEWPRVRALQLTVTRSSTSSISRRCTRSTWRVGTRRDWTTVRPTSAWTRSSMPTE